MRKDRKKRNGSKIMALLMSGVLLLGEAPVTVFADEVPVIAEETEVSEEVVLEEENTNPDKIGKEKEDKNIIKKDLYIVGRSVNASEVFDGLKNIDKVEFDDESADGNIVGVSLNENEIEALNEGVVILRVFVSGLEEPYIYEITVKNSIKFADIGEIALNLDEPVNKKVTATIENNDFKNKTICYESDDPNIVEVNAEGKLTPKRIGETKIRAYIKELEGSAEVSDYYDVTVVHSKHEYEASFDWEDDFSSCTITLTCKKEGCKEIKTDSVEPVKGEYKEGTCMNLPGDEYTVTYTIDGKEYIDSKIKPNNPDDKLLPHDTEMVEENKATCKNEGNKKHYKCKVCEKLFEDKEGNIEITKEDTVIAKAEHKWKENKKDYQKPTSKKSGKRIYKCEVCKETASVKLPKTELLYKLGLNKDTSIDSDANAYKSFSIPKTYKNKKAIEKCLSVNSKTGKISEKKNVFKYYKGLPKSFPLNVTTQDDKTSRINVKLEFPAAQSKNSKGTNYIKVTRKRESKLQSGYAVLRYTFKYNFPGATRVEMRMASNKGAFNKSFESEMKKYLSQPKSNKDSYVRAWEIKVKELAGGIKSGVKIKVTVYYGNNASKTVIIQP